MKKEVKELAKELFVRGYNIPYLTEKTESQVVSKVKDVVLVAKLYYKTLEELDEEK